MQNGNTNTPTRTQLSWYAQRVTRVALGHLLMICCVDTVVIEPLFWSIMHAHVHGSCRDDLQYCQ
jgi:hypothetical protein